MAGTEHPKPMIIGINARPDKPNFLKILSRIKAIRAIYPLSSRIEKNKNNNKICGKNESTLNKPANTPSHTNPLTQAGAEILSKPIPTSSAIQSVNIPSNVWRNTPIELIPPLANNPSNLVPLAKIKPSSPKTPMALRYNKSSENVTWKITNKITIKIGIPNHLFVKTLSILSDLVRLLFFSAFFNAGEKFLDIYLYLLSATTASKSAPNVSFLNVFLKSSTISIKSG